MNDVSRRSTDREHLFAKRSSSEELHEMYSAHDAEVLGNNSVVSDELVESDDRLFKASMRDLKAMALRRKKSLEPNRLNRYRKEQYL